MFIHMLLIIALNVKFINFSKLFIMLTFLNFIFSFDFILLAVYVIIPKIMLKNYLRVLMLCY